jgi:hypothetical protein
VPLRAPRAPQISDPGFTDANYTVTFSTTSGAEVVPEACLDNGGTCDLGLVPYPSSGAGKTYELFAGYLPTQYAIQVEGCSGLPIISACFMVNSTCADPSNPVRGRSV